MDVYAYAALCVASMPLLWWSLRGARAAGRLVQANLDASVPDLRERILAQPASERVVRPAVERSARAARRLTPRGRVAALERRVDMAGIPASWPVERVLAAKFGLGALAAAIGLLASVTDPSARTIMVSAFAAIVAFFVPDLLVLSRAQERQQAIERELPDVMDQTTICVEAGLGFEAALTRAATSGDGPLNHELAHTLQDIQLGVPRATALASLLDRTDVDDLRHFVVAVTQAERHGVPIAEILRIQAAEFREKRRQRAEEHAAKIPVKILLPLVFCILPALFIVLLGPAVIRISHANFGS